MIPQCIQSRVHVILRPRFWTVMMRARLSGVSPRIVVAWVRLAGASWWHQSEQFWRYHHHVIAVGGVFRAHASPIWHMAIYIDRIRRVHRVQRLELDLDLAVAVLNLYKQVQEEGYDICCWYQESLILVTITTIYIFGIELLAWKLRGKVFMVHLRIDKRAMSKAKLYAEGR